MKGSSTSLHTRKNGFQRPLHPLQVISWVYFGLKSVSFYLIVTPAIINMNLAYYISILSIYGMLIVLVVSLAVKATFSNPTDPLVLMQ